MSETFHSISPRLFFGIPIIQWVKRQVIAQMSLLRICLTILFTDLDNGQFPLLTLSILSAKESLWGFLNNIANFNLSLLNIIA